MSINALVILASRLVRMDVQDSPMRVLVLSYFPSKIIHNLLGSGKFLFILFSKSCV